MGEKRRGLRPESGLFSDLTRPQQPTRAAERCPSPCPSRRGRCRQNKQTCRSRSRSSAERTSTSCSARRSGAGWVGLPRRGTCMGTGCGRRLPRWGGDDAHAERHRGGTRGRGASAGSGSRQPGRDGRGGIIAWPPFYYLMISRARWAPRPAGGGSGPQWRLASTPGRPGRFGDARRGPWSRRGRSRRRRMHVSSVCHVCAGPGGGNVSRWRGLFSHRGPHYKKVIDAAPFPAQLMQHRS